MTVIHKSREGCPRETSYNEPCPYDPSTGLCAAVMSIDAPCPFFQEADPDQRHGDDTLTPSPTATAAAFAQAFCKSAAKVAARAIAKTLLEETPGTVQHLNMKLQERIDRHQTQTAMSELLRVEKGEHVKRLKTQHRPIRWERRPELAGYFDDHELWPSDCPIVTLGIF